MGPSTHLSAIVLSFEDQLMELLLTQRPDRHSGPRRVLVLWRCVGLNLGSPNSGASEYSDRGHRSGLAGVHLKVNQASGKQTDVARLQRVIPQPVVLSVHEGDIELTLQQHQNFAGAGMPVRQVYPTGFEIDSPRSETLSVQSWKLGCGCEGRYRAGERRGAFGRFA
ncbi:uncharacterized protein [Physcomitrium patens]|uniref:uncharacterized protein n=1 Tax=Physcomitrium patens TaxID=3218 RepID=UPI003CCE4E09